MAPNADTLAHARAHGELDAVRAAVESERAHTRAWLHDTVLQVLEYLATGGYADEPDAAELMRVAGGAASDLRAVIEDAAPPAPESLVRCLRDVVTEAEALAPHPVALVLGRLDGAPEGARARELAAAVREALTNVRKHARAGRAVVSCSVEGGVATVVVSDDGAGFDAAATPLGAGLRHSVIGRLRREGGSVTIDSRPGAGTRVTLRLLGAPPAFYASVAGVAGERRAG